VASPEGEGPAAAMPAVRTKWVMLALRNVLLVQLFQAKLGDLRLFFGRNTNFCNGIILQSGGQQIQHFLGGFTRRADDEDIPETQLISGVALSERLDDLVRGRAHGCLFPFGEMMRGGKPGS